MANNIVFFEIPGDDPEKLRKFYSTIFDWKIEELPATHYWHIETEKGLTGGIPKRSELPEPIREFARMNYISVDDVNNHCDLIEREGGRIIHPRTPVKGHGWYAVVKDPEGNLFGLWKKDPEAQ